MKTAKDIIEIAVFTALLLVAQLSLSFVSGIELVTVILLSYVFVGGLKKGMAVSTCFSVLRCLVFGFFPNVLLLYLIYYNLFSVIVGLVGIAFKRTYSIASHITVTILGAALTTAFTLIDDLFTPLLYGYDVHQMQAYFFASLSTMGINVMCSVITILVLFAPILSLLNKLMPGKKI